VPLAPSAPTVEPASSSSLDVNWKAPDSDAPITDYDVRFRETASDGWTDWPHDDTDTSTTIDGLSPETEYEVQVAAGSEAGVGEWSPSGSAETRPVSVDAVPLAPSAPTVEPASPSSLDVNWKAPDSDAPITDYDVRFRETASDGWTDWPHDDTDTSTTIDGLSPETEYEVQVAAGSEAGVGEWSPSGSAETRPVSVDRNLPRISITSGSQQVTEGTPVIFNLRSDPTPPANITVNVRVSETGEMLSAVGRQTATIDSGSGTATLTVATDGDAEDESDSTVTATVVSGDGYEPGSSSRASVTVADDDDPLPEVSVALRSGQAQPIAEGETILLEVRITEAPTTALTVGLRIDDIPGAGATVISGSPPATVTIAASATKADFSINTDDDNVDDIPAGARVFIVVRVLPDTSDPARYRPAEGAIPIEVTETE
jgi:chitodextrinase